MALPDIRQRAGYLFLVVILGHIALISTQVNSRSGGSLIEAVIFGVVTEVQRATGAVVGGTWRVWGGYVDLRGVRAENSRLRQDLRTAELELQQQRALIDRLPGLSRLDELQARTAFDTLAAEVIAAGASPDFRTLTIGRGRHDGVIDDLAVIAPRGVVGRVVLAGSRAAKVQLLINHNAAIGALDERTRALGVVMGIGDDRVRFDYVAETAEVAVGDVLLSSGMDGIYPKGLTIGHVESVSRSGGRYRQILVKPAVDFSALEEVLVVLTPPLAAEVETSP